MQYWRMSFGQVFIFVIIEVKKVKTLRPTENIQAPALHNSQAIEYVMRFRVKLRQKKNITHEFSMLEEDTEVDKKVRVEVFFV